MFRIDKVFENYQTELIKVEGEIRESNMQDWAESLQSCTNGSPKQIIFDLCDATFISSKAVEILIQRLAANVFLLNSPTAVKNLVHSAGWSQNILE